MLYSAVEVQHSNPPIEIVIRKGAHACDFCRVKKIRCAGNNPCDNCVKHGVGCNFTARQRRQRKKRDELPSLSQRFDRGIGQLDLAGKSGSASSQLPGLIGSKLNDISVPHQFRGRYSKQSQQQRQNPLESGPNDRAVEVSTEVCHHDQGASIPRPSSIQPDMLKTPSQLYVSDAPWDRLESREYSIAGHGCEDTGGYHIFKEDIEYWGPRTSMSICSLAGIAWVKGRVKSNHPDFQATANYFTQNVARLLKLERQPTKQRKEEPDFDNAVKFTKAFFEETPEAALGIVRRSCFESRLRSFHNNSQTDNNFAWFAMRHIIFAYGCRTVMSKTASYSEAQQESWSYFENALSVHTEILCFRSSLVGAQALTLMAYFAEALSCRMIQYILVATAYRLACGQGLHTQPSPSWKLPQEERLLRQCVFWAIYCLEKQVACRSGRPSIINDEEINCNLPISNRADGSVNLKYIEAYVKVNHLSSVTRKMLSRTSGWRQAPEEQVDNTRKLHMKLEDLRVNLQNQCQIGLPMKMTELPAGLDMRQAISLQFLYYSLVWDIHATLAHPWFRTIVGLERYSDFRNQIANSCAIVADTSRSAILDCRFIHIDASCSMSVAYYSPLYAVVNLFIGLLHDPSAASAKTDLRLMDVAAGYFARLEYSTDSQWSVPLVRDVAILARNTVESPYDGPGPCPSYEENILTANPSCSNPEPMSESEIRGNEVARNWQNWSSSDHWNLEMWGIWQPGTGTDDEVYISDTYSWNT